MQYKSEFEYILNYILKKATPDEIAGIEMAIEKRKKNQPLSLKDLDFEKLAKQISSQVSGSFQIDIKAMARRIVANLILEKEPDISEEHLEKLLEYMPVYEKIKLVKKLPRKVKKKLLNSIKKEELPVLQQTLSYPKGTAGEIMNTYFIPLSPTMTVKQAIEKIHSLSRFRKFSSLHAFYVVNSDNKLLGGVTLRKLIAAPSDLKVSEVMTSVNFIKVNVNSTQEEVARMFAKYDLVIAPVVDDEYRLVGVITVDDVIDIINRINVKQFYGVGKMATEEGKEIRYSEANVGSLVRARIGWLIFLLVVNFLSGSVLKFFESALATVVALTFFIPMMLDAGGNAGTQVSISIIRAFAVGDVSFKNIWKVVKLELSAALIMASTVGFFAFLRAYLANEGLLLAVTVGLSMVCLILVAIATGIFLPILSKKIGLDPAVLAGPITTTIVDILGLIVYFNIAKLILPQLKNL